MEVFNASLFAYSFLLGFMAFASPFMVWHVIHRITNL